MNYVIRFVIQHPDGSTDVNVYFGTFLYVNQCFERYCHEHPDSYCIDLKLYKNVQF